MLAPLLPAGATAGYGCGHQGPNEAAGVATQGGGAIGHGAACIAI